MATFTTAPANYTNSSDANFRAWASYISARLEAVGIIKTADTGQIDLTTVLTPAGINTYQGYEIRRFTDALQATAPVFLKIEYGENNSADSPSIRVQFGSGSNGTGGLTGSLSGQYQAACAAVAGACSVFGSGGPARFSFCGGFTTGAGGFGQWFGFERSKDAVGADTAEAVLWLANSTASVGAAISTGKDTVVWSTTLGVLMSSLNLAIPCLFPAGATAASGAQVMVMPVWHNKGIFMNPGMNFVGYYTENIAANSIAAVIMYGTAHTYYFLPPTSAVAGIGFQGPGSGTEGLAFRYE